MTEAHTDEPARFEHVDWDAVGGRPRLSRSVLGLVVALAAFALAFAYDRYLVPAGRPTAFGWYATDFDWLYFFSLILLAYFLVSLGPSARQRARFVRELHRDKLALAGFLYLCCFFVLGTLSPFFWGTKPPLDLMHSYQPPVWDTIHTSIALNCLGEVTGRQCHGTWQYPLGTTSGGRGMLAVSVVGMRIALLITFLSSLLIVPIAVTVGTLAGYFGGVVDTVFMRLAEVFQTIPAMVAYIVLILLYGRSLWLMIVVFGLLSWGGIARLVRSDVRGRREELYTTVAASAGASHTDIIRTHILPNVSGTLIAALTLHIPFLLLTEAGLSYLTLGDTDLLSWGQVITGGLDTRWTTFPEAWWISTVPVAFLVLTVLSLHLTGDVARRTLDPRGGR